MINRLGYFLRWGIRTAILKKKIPLNSSIILTDECNLNCRHCTVANLGYPPQNLDDVHRDLKILYTTGSRILVITGGEPFLWNDTRGHDIEDVVSCAKKIGFFRVVICTNGTLLLESAADYLWVSLDGFEETHNEIRGPVYNKVVNNIVNSSHKGLYINFTINSNNYDTFPVAAEQILLLHNVRGILFHLYTRYIRGDGSLVLQGPKRENILRELAAFKRKHPFKTFNTFAGIRALQKDNWKRPIWSSVTINHGVLSECCCRVGIYDKSVCSNCGCTPAVETWVLQSFRPTAILENLRYL
jgi:MoaA/NifB/PqqE/SkfB family radical SAM enzyme